MLRKSNKGRKTPRLQNLTLSIRPAQTDRTDAFLFDDPWLIEALVSLCENPSEEKSQERLRVHFLQCGSGGLLYSFLLELAARNLLDRVTVSTSESDTKSRDELEAAVVTKQELICVHDERMLPYFDVEGDNLRIGKLIRNKITVLAGKPTEIDILVVGAGARDAAIKAVLTHFGGDEDPAIQEQKLLAFSVHPHLDIAEEAEANGWYAHPLHFAELSAAATVSLSTGQTDESKSPSAAGRLFFKGSLQTGDGEADDPRQASISPAPVYAGALLGRNAELENTIRRTLGKKRRDLSLPLRIVVTGKAVDVAFFQTLAAAIGAGNVENRIEGALDDLPEDPELLNGNVREKYVAALPRATREKLFGPWFVAGRYAFKPSVAKALHWRLNCNSHLDRESDPQWDNLLACSVSVQVYDALCGELKQLFKAKADSNNRHLFALDETIARHGVAQALESDGAEENAGSSYRLAAKYVALLPPVVLATLFKLVPGSGMFEALPMPSRPVAPSPPELPELPELEESEEAPQPEQPNHAPENKQDVAQREGVDSQGEADEVDASQSTLLIDAILVVPTLTDDSASHTRQLLEHHILEMDKSGLIVAPRSGGDDLVNWLRKYNSKPARLRNAEEIHDGFVGARALARARIDTPWAYPSFAELLEEESRSTEEYNWLFTKGDTSHLKALGPVVLDLRSVSLDFNNQSVLLDPSAMFRRRRPEKVTRALDSIDLQVRRGEVLGVVGRNGSGKSTLMRLLVGAYLPDEGERWVDGETRLVTVGTGLNQDQTGYANLMMMGQLIGMSKAEIDEKLDDIAEFTELGSALDRVVRHYSSGMRSRLSFAIATAKQSDILILDEVFATGDRFFVDKSKARIRGLIDGAKAVIIVSHQVGLLRQLATRVIWIEKGKIIMDGDPDDVVSAYLEGA